MWKRWNRELCLQLHWTRRDIIRRLRLDTPTGIMRVVTGISALLLFIALANGMSQIFRAFLPWVSGSRVGEVYWQSIGFGITTSFLFIIFSGSLIIYFVLKFSGRPYRR